MKRYLLIAVALCSISGVGIAQTQDKSKQTPFDLSADDKINKDIGITTKEEVDQLGTKAFAIYDAGKYQEAIPALEEYAKKSNWLANLIAKGVQPYYNASYDARKRINPADLEPLVAFEKKANGYKRNRNHAWVMQADCYYKMGDKLRAAELATRALNLIEVEDIEWWAKARNILYSVIGI